MSPAAGGRGGLPALAIALFVFSWGFIVVKAIPLAGPALAFWRLLILGVVLLAVAVMTRAARPRAWGPVLLAGAMFGLHQLLFIGATQRTTVAVVTLLAALQPLLVSLIGPLTVGERLRPAVVGWSLVAATGVAQVLAADVADPARSRLGDLLAVANLLVFTTYFLAAKRSRLAGTGTLGLTTAQQFVAAAVVAPVFVVTGMAVPGVAVPAEVDSAAAVGPLAAWALIALFALVPGNGHLLVNWSHDRVSAAVASLVLAGIPLLSSVWAAWLFGEPLTWRHALGGGLLMASVWGAQRAENSAQRRQDAADAAGEAVAG